MSATNHNNDNCSYSLEPFRHSLMRGHFFQISNSKYIYLLEANTPGYPWPLNDMLQDAKLQVVGALSNQAVVFVLHLLYNSMTTLLMVLFDLIVFLRWYTTHSLLTNIPTTITDQTSTQSYWPLHMILIDHRATIYPKLWGLIGIKKLSS